MQSFTYGNPNEDKFGKYSNGSGSARRRKMLRWASGIFAIAILSVAVYNWSTVGTVTIFVPNPQKTNDVHVSPIRTTIKIGVPFDANRSYASCFDTKTTDTIKSKDVAFLISVKGPSNYSPLTATQKAELDAKKIVFISGASLPLEYRLNTWDQNIWKSFPDRPWAVTVNPTTNEFSFIRTQTYLSSSPEFNPATKSLVLNGLKVRIKDKALKYIYSDSYTLEIKDNCTNFRSVENSTAL